jgi:lambda family phage portal protein
LIDGLLKHIVPNWALKQEAARLDLEQRMAHAALQKQQADFALDRIKKYALAYEASELTRFNQDWTPIQYAGDVPTGARFFLRKKAWDLYRNNSIAVAAVKCLCGRIAPPKLFPESLAMKDDGTPDLLFRERARIGWHRFAGECSSLGKPGRGGLTINQLWEQALREIILSGEVLLFSRFHTQAEAERYELTTAPLTYDVIEGERLLEWQTAYATNVIDGNEMYEGIELDQQTRRRIAYHILKQHPNHPLTFSLESDRISADDIIHAYVTNRPSQYRGYSWFAPVLETFRDIADLQFNERVASTAAACPVLVIKQNMAFGAMPGLTAPIGNPRGIKDGNRQMSLQPGMSTVLNPNEEMESFNSNRPNDKIEDFIKHLLRTMAGVFPVKASELHGDFRESSFSSEAAAENALLPQIIAIHDWFVSTVCKPMYAQWVMLARANGYFNGFEAGTGDVNDRRLTEATFPLPETRSINPVNDVKAAQMRILGGLSSPQKEAAKLGNNATDNIHETSAYLKLASDNHIPESFALASLGVTIQPVLTEDNEGNQQPAE